MDPLSAIASAIAIIQAISSTYKVIEDLKNLPKAFREVNKSLPIVEDTLKIARQQLLGKSVDESTKKAIEPYIIASEEKAKSLRDIFKKVEQGQVQGKDTKGWSVVDFYRTTVVPMGKAHRVESLMKDILEAVKNLATYQVFKTATQQQVKKLEDAINELAKVEPSLPDSDFEAKSTTNVSQSVAEGGKGNQAVNSGPGQQDNNFGNKFESGGGAFNFVYNIYRSRPNGSDALSLEYSNLPSIHVSYFVERTKLLQDLREIFDTGPRNSSVPIITVLSAMGGQGKSQIALKYCHSSASGSYRGIFWVNALCRSTTLESFQQIADEISQKKIEGVPVPDPSEKLLTWDRVTEERYLWDEPWILVFDNYDDQEGFPEHEEERPRSFSRLVDFFPSRGKGSILVTTRDSRVGQGLDWHRIEVPNIEMDDGVDLLKRFSNRADLTKNDLLACEEIVKKLDYLSLAIDQTAWFIFINKLKFHTFVEQIDDYMPKALTTTPRDMTWSYRRAGRLQNCNTTYEYSLSILDWEVQDVAWHFLTLSAYFGNAGIQGVLFKEYYTIPSGEIRPPWLSFFSRSDVWDMDKLRTLTADLSYRHLVTFHDDPNPESNGVHYSLHPVIREWLRERSQSSAEHFTAEAVTVLQRFVETTNINQMSLQTRLDILTHMSTIMQAKSLCLYSGFGLGTPGVPEDHVPPALSFAIFCRKFSRLKVSKKLLSDLLTVRECASIAKAHPRSVKILIELAETYADNAEHSVAEEYFISALKLCSDTLVSLRCQALLGLANALGAQTKLRSARAPAEQALVLAVSVKDDGRMLIQAKITVARVEGSLGHVPRAEALIQGALNDAKNSKTIGPRDNLTLEAELLDAYRYMARGDFGEAKKVTETTLQRIEEENGQDHRLALNALQQLGQIYGQMTQYYDARLCFQTSQERAAALFGDTPGDCDIEVLIGYTYLSERNFTQAKARFERTCEKSKGKRGFEMAFLRASIALLQLYIKYLSFFQAIPHIWLFFWYFPFAFFVRTQRGILMFLTAVLLLLVNMCIQGQFLTLAAICGFVVVGWILLSR